MSSISDTRKRAELRGREAVAQWRIRAAVWAGRVFAVIVVVTAIVSLVQGGVANWPGVVVLLLFAAGIAFAAERMKKGSQVAAVLLLCLFIVAKLGAWWLGGERWYAGALWAVIIIGALINGIWGTFALAQIRREAQLVPPAPPRD
jgi:hypothetical protein